MRDEKFVDLAASVKHGGLRSVRLHLRVRSIGRRCFGCLPCVTLPLHMLVLPSTLNDVGFTQTKVTKRRAVEEVSVRAVSQAGKVWPGGVGCDRLRLKLLFEKVPPKRAQHRLRGRLLVHTLADLVSRPLPQPARQVAVHLICIVGRVVDEEDMGWRGSGLCRARMEQREGLAVATSVHGAGGGGGFLLGLLRRVASDNDGSAVSLERRIHAGTPRGPRHVPPPPRTLQVW